MLLATRCPHCHTTFRVVEDQLKLYGGIVRCGVCQQIFNGADQRVNAFSEQPVPNPTSAPQSEIANSEAAPIQTTPADSSSPIQTQPDRIEPAAVAPELSLPAAAEPPPFIDADEPAEFSIAADQLAEAASLATRSSDSHDSFGTMSVPPPEEIQPNAVEEELPVLSLDLDENKLDAPSWVPEQIDPLTLNTDEIYTVSLDELGWAAPIQAAKADANDGLGAPEELVADLPLFDQVVSDTLPKVPDEAAPAATEVPEEPQLSELLPVDIPEPGFVRRAKKQHEASRSVRFLLALSSFLLLILLAVQFVYAFNDRITAWLPQAEPIIAEVCSILECETRLFANIDDLAIDSSELQALPNQAGTFSLNLVLHNLSSSAQAWPNIELSLNDESGQPILRRVLVPEEYLAGRPDSANAANPAKGFAGRTEQPVKLVFTLEQVKAVGYRVYLFYP